MIESEEFDEELEENEWHEVNEMQGWGNIVMREIISQAHAIFLAVVPVLLSPFFIGPGDFAIAGMEQLSLGYSDMILNLLVALIFSEAMTAWTLYPFKKSRIVWRGLFSCTVYIIVVVAALAFRNPEQSFNIGDRLLVLTIQIWIPELIIALSRKKLRNIVNSFAVSFKKTVVLGLSTMVIIEYIRLAMSNLVSDMFELFIQGLIYPTFAITLRFGVRGILGKAVDKERTRSTKLRIAEISNEAAVTYFLVPGFFSIMLLQNRDRYLLTLGMQVFLEPLSAFFYAFFAVWLPKQMRANRCSEEIHPTPRFLKRSSLKVLEKIPFDGEVFEGIISSEVLGEKRAIIIGALLALFLNKDASEILLRLMIALIVESLADFVKVAVYLSFGMITGHVRHSPRPLMEFCPSMISTALSFFSVVNALIYLCNKT